MQTDGTESHEEPRPLAESLDRVARALGGPGADALGEVFNRWEAVVGAAIAAHSRPVSLVRGVLVVAVDEPIWHTQLTYLETQLLERLNAVAGPGAVARVEVRVRPL